MDRSVSSRRAVVIVVLALLAAGFSRLPQQAPPRDQAPAPAQQPSGTGRITVLVVADDTGAPIKRVRLSLNGMLLPPRPPAGAPGGAVAIARIESSGGTPITGPEQAGRVHREAETDEAGRAEFDGLPAASYSVFPSSPPAGFVRQTMSQSVQLTDGASTSLTVRLVRGGAITGRVVDEAGDPLSRVSVRALRKDSGYGMPRFATSGSSGQTDDRGQFRIYDLAPGDYYVSANLMGQGPVGPRAPAEPGPRMGYLPTFHPGVPGLDGAQLVAVKAGQDAAGVDFGMLRGRLCRLTATAADSTGAPLSTRMGGLLLHPRNRELGTFARSAFPQGDGTFTIPDVPPGEYILTAFTARPDETTPGQPPANQEGAWMPVTVAGDDVSVNIQTNTGAVLSGRVVREGPMPPPPPLPGVAPMSPPTPQALRVMVGTRPHVISAMAPGSNLGKPEYSAEDGTFRITGARGPMMLTASSGVGVVKSIRRGATDLLGAPLELTGTERIDDIEIVLTTDTGYLRGSVTRADGKPALNTFVVVFSEDTRRWSAPFVSISRTMGAVPPAPAGVAVAPAGIQAPGTPTFRRAPGDFTVGRLLPGRYYVATVADAENGGFPPPDADLLASLKPKAVTVTIVAGEVATVQLRQ